MTPRIRTSRGIEIGGAYIPKPPEPSEDALYFQRLYIDKQEPQMSKLYNVLLATVVGILLAVWVFYWWSA
jgi:hypothetical protein